MCMKKSFYLFAAAAMALSTNAYAQFEISADTDIDSPAEWSGFSDENGTMIVNATVNITDPVVNYCAFAHVNGEPVILGGNAKVKFHDTPETDAPSAEDIINSGFEAYMSDINGNQLTAIPYHWIIQGEGNEIYLDSRCTMGGTITGDGDLTIHMTENDLLNITFYETGVDADGNPTFNGAFALTEFTGTLYLKALDGYKCDTVFFGDSYPGRNATGTFAALNVYNAIPHILDVTALNRPVIQRKTQTATAILSVPLIHGAAEVKAAPGAYFIPKAIGGVSEADFYGSGTGRSCEIYLQSGADHTFNGEFNPTCSYAYCRTTPNLFFNSNKPNLSNSTNGLSQRGSGGIHGGTGYLATSSATNSGRACTWNPGYPYHTVGQMTMRYPTPNQADTWEFDFDGQHMDILNIPDSGNFQFSNNNNKFRIALLPSAFKTAPKEGNYQLINGPLTNQMTPINDTIGFYHYGATSFVMQDSAAVADGAEETWIDTITYCSNIYAKFPSMNDTIAYTDYYGNTVYHISGYDFGNQRYHHLVKWYGPGEGMGRDTVAGTYYKSVYPGAEQAYADRQAAIDEINQLVFVPGTNEQVKFTETPTLTNAAGNYTGSGWMAQLFAYDYVGTYNFNVTLSVPVIDGDSAFSAEEIALTSITSGITYSKAEEESLTEKAYASRRMPYVEGSDTTWYWFDFRYLMTNGRVQLLSDKVSEVDPNETPKNAGDVDAAINTVRKEIKDIDSRRIYTLDGKLVKTFQKGLNIVTTRYSDGTIETKKVFFRE